MPHPIFFASVLLASGVFITPANSYAQSASDSVAVMEALGSSLRDQPIYGVADRFACYHTPSCTPDEVASPAVTELLQVLASTANLPVSAASQFAPPPPCPSADDGARSGNAGYFVHVGVPQIQGAHAIVTVARACTWRQTARDPIAMVGEEYVLEKQEDEWRVVQRRFTWRN